MRQPIIAAMSGVSLAVLGLSLHASQSTSVSVEAAPAGPLVSPIGPADPTQTPALTHPPTAAPSRTGGAPAASTATRTTAAKSPAPTVVVNGNPADTKYGPVQVQITLRGGHIINSDAVDYPQAGRDQEINSQAVPQLNQETVQANSARIDTVSGATYTSGGYRQSLQSALDAAHRAGAW